MKAINGIETKALMINYEAVMYIKLIIMSNFCTFSYGAGAKMHDIIASNLNFFCSS